MEIAILAAGCFWGPEIKFSKIDGIIKTEVGYCGGNSSITTYKEVCTGNTNHAEVVKLDFDEKIITYEKILKIFYFNNQYILDNYKDKQTQFCNDLKLTYVYPGVPSYALAAVLLLFGLFPNCLNK